MKKTSIRTAVGLVALFLALGGTSYAAGKLLTGANIQDDSLTGADVVESSLAKVPAATDADQLGGTPAGSFLRAGSAAGGDLVGAYPDPELTAGAVTSGEIANQSVGLVDLANGAVSAPKLLGGAAATNIWGDNQWAPANATQRGYVHIQLERIGHSVLDNDTAWDAGGRASISYPVPLDYAEPLVSHVIRHDLLDPEKVPDGCGGSMFEPTAEPGHICIFYDASSDGDVVFDVTPPLAHRYGLLLGIDDGDDENHSASADVVWAMTPPVG